MTDSPVAPPGAMKVVAVCTGNVARSAMLGFMVAAIARERGWEWAVRSAGTHVIEGSTMSSRTRDALVSVEELGAVRYSAHRSHQLDAEDLAWADVVLCAEADHVRFARALSPECAGRVVQVRQFVQHASPGDALDLQLASVAVLALDSSLDVVDPAGAQQAAYDDVARDLWALALGFARVVGPGA